MELPELPKPRAWSDSHNGQTDWLPFKPERKPSTPGAEWLPMYTADQVREIQRAAAQAALEAAARESETFAPRPLTYAIASSIRAIQVQP